MNNAEIVVDKYKLVVGESITWELFSKLPENVPLSFRLDKDKNPVFIGIIKEKRK